jgi:hypothetical protein
MSPFTIDEAKMQGKPEPGQDSEVLVSLDPHKPPVKAIPHMDFPRVVYKHPREPFKTIEHRNARHELVEEEVIPTEHLTMRVDDKRALEKALKEGWVMEPYIQETPPDKNADLYGRTEAAKTA